MLALHGAAPRGIDPVVGRLVLDRLAPPATVLRSALISLRSYAPLYAATDHEEPKGTAGTSDLGGYFFERHARFVEMANQALVEQWNALTLLAA
ncbi:hypothetical protein, partial [Pseudomonas sp. 18083194]